MLSLLVVSLGCIGNGGPAERQGKEEAGVVAECKSLCQQKKEAGEDLSEGPCLSNEIKEDWVCDVAHQPRQEVDDNPENQCEAFREGEASHFVEVTPECEFIKKY